MKKLILAAIALTTAASVFAQGTVRLDNRITGAAVNQTTHIWGPGTGANSSVSLIGLGSNDSPTAGATAFTGVMIGSSGRNTQYGYATTFAQLIGAPGTATEASLVPVGQTTTFRSGTSLGDMAAITSTLPASFPDNSTAGGTFEIVAWDNFSGLYPTWAQASTAWNAGLIAAGHSPLYFASPLGGSINTAPSLVTAQSMQSFQLYFIPAVPEPSTFALAGLGAAALLIFRRRK